MYAKNSIFSSEYSGNCENIHGTVISGFGLSTKKVRTHTSEIARTLGQDIFPGSLNLILDKPVLFDPNYAFISRRWSGLWYWPIMFSKTPAWAYRWNGMAIHVVEVVCAEKLRDTYMLFDGMAVDFLIEKRIVVQPSWKRKLVWYAFWKGREHLYYSSRYRHSIENIRMPGYWGQDRQNREVRRSY